MQQLVLIEILAVPAEPSRGRHNPRVVKRKMSGFPTKARAAPAAREVIYYRDHIRIVAPATDAAAPPDPRLRPSPKQAEQAPHQAYWHDHVRAWRESGLKRRTLAPDWPGIFQRTESIRSRYGSLPEPPLARELAEP